MSDPAKLANVRHELDLLNTTWQQAPASATDIADLWARLRTVNERLWVVEDDLRILEKAQRFDAGFVRLARSSFSK
jgi:hypothetical protein